MEGGMWSSVPLLRNGGHGGRGGSYEASSDGGWRAGGEEAATRRATAERAQVWSVLDRAATYGGEHGVWMVEEVMWMQTK